MKRFEFLNVLLIGCLVLSACSSDDSDNSETIEDAQLIEVWMLQQSTLNRNEVTSQNIVEYTSDNRTVFTYQDSGSNGEDIIENGSWVRNGDNLQITWDESDSELEVYELTIVELTDSSLKWRTTIVGERCVRRDF